jgi:predicted porin
VIRASYSTVKYSNLPLPAGIPAGSQKDPKADKFALGYVHNLSKRTALYATAAYVKNKDNEQYGSGLAVSGTYAASAGMVPKTSFGYDLGIRHSF